MPYHQTSISASEALDLVQRVRDHAEGLGLVIAVSVVDAQGIVLACLRMDRAAPPILEFATDKAFTAATMRRTTEAFAARMAESASLTMGLANRPRLLAWGGGLPIVLNGAVIGGIGVSGAKDYEDIACAEAALSGAGLDWRL